MPTLDAGFYITGGTVPGDALSYVTRRADEQLFEGLRQGEFCYVLTSRQMGKSSLMVRTALRLKEEGVAAVVLDLTAIGQNLSAEQWYEGLLDLLGRQLHLEDELQGFWESNERLGPLQRWMTALREVVLAHGKAQSAERKASGAEGYRGPNSSDALRHALCALPAHRLVILI